jgi:AraC-like DNA-binding protein
MLACRKKRVAKAAGRGQSLTMTSATLHSYDVEAAARDYPRVTEALNYLGDRWQEHPDLAEAARAAGLSPHHFQRVFTRWVGVSPKRYVGALAHGAAREAIDEGASVMDAAFEAGLSGPGRLHDLFIAHEAVTPGDAKRRGAGLSFVWGVAPTPFGDGVFLVAPRGLSALAFTDGRSETGFDDLHARYPAADYRRDDAEAAAGVARAVVDPVRGDHDLQDHRRAGLQRQGLPRRRGCGGREPDQLADPVSPRPGVRWPSDRLSLGRGAQARHADLGEARGVIV